MLIATLEIVAQSLVCYFENDWTLNNMWHVIGWSVWFVIITIIRTVRKANYA